MPYCAKCKKKRDDDQERDDDQMRDNHQMRNCCDGIYYCNRKCERANYANHKDSCPKVAAAEKPTLHPAESTLGKKCTAPSEPGAAEKSALLPPPEPLIKDIYDPFNRLKRGDYLQGRPDLDVYRTLIDSYRLRMSDNNVFAGVRHEDSIYGKSKDGIAGFLRFLNRAKAIPRMMPSWWDVKKEAECVELGRQTGWSSLSAVIHGAEIRKHYNPPMHFTARKHFTDVARKYYKDVAHKYDKNAARPDHYDIYIDVQLRLLAEDIYDTGIGDTKTRFLREEMKKFSNEELSEITTTGNSLRRALFQGLKKSRPLSSWDVVTMLMMDASLGTWK
ncbi:hypothetical protein CIB48_g11698 [Xylaria polymorpha]|nr:hypothetical protein CIB48_g11698 [Xylaria polymorpha]